MKQKSLFAICFLRIVFVFLLCGMMPQIISASNDFINNAIEDFVLVWDETTKSWVISERSLPLIPVASISEDILLIENLAVDRDITISIINSYGQKVYEDVIVKLSSSYVVISLDGFPEGDYTLELRNSSGGYLCGGFLIY